SVAGVGQGAVAVVGAGGAGEDREGLVDGEVRPGLEHEGDGAGHVRGGHRRAVEGAVAAVGERGEDVDARCGDVGHDVGVGPFGGRGAPVALVDDLAAGEVGNV